LAVPFIPIMAVRSFNAHETVERNRAPGEDKRAVRRPSGMGKEGAVMECEASERVAWESSSMAAVTTTTLESAALKGGNDELIERGNVPHPKAGKSLRNSRADCSQDLVRPQWTDCHTASCFGMELERLGAETF